MKTVAIFGNKREDLGKTSTKKLKDEGKIPCVLYGGENHIHFSAYASDFKDLIYTPNTYKVQLDIDGSEHQAILKAAQFHPVNDQVIHADFFAVNDSEPVELLLPIKVTGNSPGVREGGKLVTKMRKIRVKGLIDAMPDFIEVKIDSLVIGKSVKIEDLSVDGLELLDAIGNPVVSVITTRAARSAEGEEEEAEGEAAEATEGAAAE